ncbi:MAG: isoprenylcysteine carboxylmethyltransferase family protein [Rubrobacter sp.]|nr:isoprenylcysteine carboxylmethyltransferase family protein [Rubrobacter sp.]
MSRRVFLIIVAEFLVLIGLLFIPAGTVGWVAGWVFVALLCGITLLVVRMLARNDPELLQEWISSPIQRNQPLWDTVLLPVLMLLFIAWLILMPLDAVRFGWSDVPVWLQVLGALGIMLSFYGMYLVYRENAYLYPVVKLQEEQRQSVVTTGPYRYVRHPMYASGLVLFPATALLLGSWLGLLLSPVLMALIILRTALEDRMLRDGLAGYAGYARTVRYRLVPLVW